MHRFITTLRFGAVVLATLVVTTPPSAAQTAPPTAEQPFGGCGRGELGANIICPHGYEVPGESAAPTGQTTESGSGTSAAPSGQRWEDHPRIIDGPDGSACISQRYVPVPADTPPPEVPWDPNTAITSEAGVPILPCPPTAQSAQASAAAIAVRAWDEINLPVPKPRIAPGRAITGTWAYLETRNQTQFQFHKDTPVGTLDIRATGTYIVDWGDGETSWPSSVEGKPWPDGEIRHEYINVGRYDVVVTERWRATWQIGPWSGVLRDLRTTGRIDGFPVEQIQAVIRS